MAVVRLYKKCIHDLNSMLSTAAADEAAQALAADNILYLLEDIRAQEQPARAACKKLVLDLKVRAEVIHLHTVPSTPCLSCAATPACCCDYACL